MGRGSDRLEPTALGGGGSELAWGIAAAVSVGLLIYLVYALLRPERF